MERNARRNNHVFLPPARTWILVREPCAPQIGVPLKEADVGDAIPAFQRGAESDGRDTRAYAGELAVGGGGLVHG